MLYECNNETVKRVLVSVLNMINATPEISDSASPFFMPVIEDNSLRLNSADVFELREAAGPSIRKCVAAAAAASTLSSAEELMFMLSCRRDLDVEVLGLEDNKIYQKYGASELVTRVQVTTGVVENGQFNKEQTVAWTIPESFLDPSVVKILNDNIQVRRHQLVSMRCEYDCQERPTPSWQAIAYFDTWIMCCKNNKDRDGGSVRAAQVLVLAPVAQLRAYVRTWIIADELVAVALSPKLLSISEVAHRLVM